MGNRGLVSRIARGLGRFKRRLGRAHAVLNDARQSRQCTLTFPVLPSSQPDMATTPLLAA